MIWVAVLMSIPFGWIIVRQRTLRRLAVRNVMRRPIEGILVVLGSMLGTAIITGSLVVGDTIDRSIRAAAYDQLGPIDETVSVFGLEQGADLVDRFADFSSPDVDGVLSFTTAGAAVIGTGPSGGTQPRAQLIEVDFTAARAFGPDPTITGVVGATPDSGQAAITVDLADKLRLDVGDEIVAFAFGQPLPLTVDRVLKRTGVAGYWGIDGRQQSYNVLVAPGTIAALVAGGIGTTDATTGIVPPEVIVAFSNLGGVESGAVLTDAATAAIDTTARTMNVHTVPVKQTLLNLADINGKGLSQLYFTVGMFAVAAGVMLLVNIFVMLADERRSELGMLRAVGMRRSPLVGAFALEGWLYALIASAVGAFVGIGVGRLIAWRADSILSSGQETTALHMVFTFTGISALTGFAMGFLISLVTVLVSSIRIARFNVIRAIRDVQEPPRARPRRRVALVGISLALFGAAFAIIGLFTSNGYGVMLGPAFFIAGVAPQLARRWAGRSVNTIAATLTLVWAVAAVPVLGAMDVAIVIPIFLAQGLTMSAASIVLVSLHQDLIGRTVARMTGRRLPVRLGLAYPVARRFRTGMTLGMFSIVLLTLVYMSVLSFMFRSQTQSFVDHLGGGFDIVATSNPSDPVSTDDLKSVPGVDAVAPLGYLFADFSLGDSEPMAWPVTGFDRAIVAAPPELDDTGTFPSNEAAWAAVEADPTLIIVDDNFLITAGGPGGRRTEIGDTVTISDPQSGEARELIVAARSENDLIGSGAFVSERALQEIFDERAIPSRFFVSARDPNAAAASIRTTFVSNGADATTVTHVVDSVLAQSTSFFTLMQQFVGAGLVVGVAGIGVIMVRAVRERRREVGVLRSLGFTSNSVGEMMVFEAGFVAAEGILIGVGIALVASYGLTATGADWADGMTWGVPVTEVLLIVAVAIFSTLFAAVWPARRAAHTQPASALRITD
jgi:putative ABC transport system permease protein